jgi:hypothetical protein
LKRKSDTFDAIVNFCNLFKTQFKFDFKFLKFDGGGEFVDQEVESFLTSRGILFAPNPANTPQHTGVAERHNQTFEAWMRCILRESGLPDYFWAEALAYVIFLKNRIPRKNDVESAFEKVFGRKPSLKYCQKFGSRVAYLNTYYKKKLEPRSREAIFIGYADNEDFVYKVFDPVKNRIFRTRDISFNLNQKNFKSIAFEDFSTKRKEKEDDSIDIKILDNIPDVDVLKFDDENSNLGGEGNNISKQPIIIDQPLVNDDNVEENEDDGEDQLIIIPRRKSNRTIGVDPHSYHKDRSLWKNHDESLKKKPVMIETNEEDALMSYCFGAFETEPTTFKEAIARKDEPWDVAIQTEVDNLLENKTWKELKPEELPKGSYVVGSRWVFKYKYDTEGKRLFKVRLVAKGYTQIHGLHFTDTSSPVTRYTTVRMVLAIAALRNYEVDQIDVIAAFLNGDLEEDIYLELPEGIKTSNNCRVVKLIKSIYGLRQSSYIWFKKFTKTILEYGFKASKSDPCLFILVKGEEFVLLVLYVDDGLIVGPRHLVDEVKKYLMEKFKMRDLGVARKFLSLEISRTPQGVTINQRDFVKKLIEKFGVEGTNARYTPLNQGTKEILVREDSEYFEDINYYQQLIGSLLYVSNGTRPDISYAVSLLSRSMRKPSKNDFAQAKHVLSYLNQTSAYGIQYDRTKFDGLNNLITGYCDSSYKDCLDKKSTAGYGFLMLGGAVSWRSAKQKTTAISVMEAELMSICSTMKEALWMLKIKGDLLMPKHGIRLYSDSKSAVSWCQNYHFSDLTKHIEVKYHRIVEEIEKKNIILSHVPGTEQLADIFTKALGKELFQKFVKFLGLVNLNH